MQSFKEAAVFAAAAASFLFVTAASAAPAVHHKAQAGNGVTKSAPLQNHGAGLQRLRDEHRRPEPFGGY